MRLKIHKFIYPFRINFWWLAYGPVTRKNVEPVSRNAYVTFPFNQSFLLACFSSYQSTNARALEIGINGAANRPTFGIQYYSVSVWLRDQEKISKGKNVAICSFSYFCRRRVRSQRWINWFGWSRSDRCGQHRCIFRRKSGRRISWGNWNGGTSKRSS